MSKDNWKTRQKESAVAWQPAGPDSKRTPKNQNRCNPLLSTERSPNLYQQ